jgi:hypothetical protein
MKHRAGYVAIAFLSVVISLAAQTASSGSAPSQVQQSARLRAALDGVEHSRGRGLSFSATPPWRCTLSSFVQHARGRPLFE